MDSNQLALILFISGVALAGGTYLYSIRHERTKHQTQENMNETTAILAQGVKTQESPKTTEQMQIQTPVSQKTKSITHRVLINELSSMDANLGIWSGVKFGFGFALGITIFLFVTTIFLGSLIKEFMQDNVNEVFTPTPSYNQNKPSLLDAARR